METEPPTGNEGGDISQENITTSSQNSADGEGQDVPMSQVL